MRVQLLTHAGCPSALTTRELLVRLLAVAGVDAAVEEIDTTSEGAPRHLRGWGSPTILIDGVDAGGEPSPSGTCCRLYRDDNGRLGGAPSEALVAAALRAHG